MPSVTSLSLKASFTAKGMTLVIPPRWLKPTEGKTPALSSLKNNYRWKANLQLRGGAAQWILFMDSLRLEILRKSE